MNKILEIDENNFQAIVQPGVITQVFQEELNQKDYFILLPCFERQLFYRRKYRRVLRRPKSS